VQRFRAAVEPLGQALAEWEIVGRVMTTLGESLSATRAEHLFRQLAEAVPAFAGLSYQLIGDTGHAPAAAAAAGAAGAAGRRGAGAPPSGAAP